MQSTPNNDRSTARHRLTDYPALAALRLKDTDLDELTRQGSVCGERRGQRLLFKLRFRRQRQQIVRYVGDARSADAVRSELSALQADVRVTRELKAIARIAGRKLRDAKITLKPILECNGFRFHGLSIRRSRQPPTNDSNSTSQS